MYGRCAAAKTILYLGDKIATPVTEGSAGHLYELRFASSQAPILKRTDGVSPEPRRRCLGDEPVEMIEVGGKRIGSDFVHR